MRIIGGEARGHRLRAPCGHATRPTSDRVREAIFDIIGPPPAQAAVLDLFAGSGAMGLEALSRGADRAVFVEKDQAALHVLHANIASLGLGDRTRVMPSPAGSSLRRLHREDHGFAWIFVDPPYAGSEGPATLALLGDPFRSLCVEGALVVLEHDQRRPPAQEYGVLSLVDQRRYGDTGVSFYRNALEIVGE
ncbi:MAG: 16S rRNA (guanine(966)-N(2))-methyltransferase RsmD [Pseudomonadota bacterium]